MGRALPRTNFNSSRLFRLLAELAVVDDGEPKQDFAERLGHWLNFADAITLHAAQGPARPPAAPGAALPVNAAELEAEFSRVRTVLANSITASCSADGGETRIKLPTPKTGADIAAIDLAVAYEPYRRFYQTHQGELEASVRPLRGKARQALARSGSQLGQLASLDAALDQALGARERQLLATVPVLLEKRFAQLANAHRQRLVEQLGDPAWSMQPAGWLADFGKELKMVLLAELDLRLQPTVGLIEALSNEAA
ncbi:MAG: hypothetical protein H6R17_2114 [Proteobacteria bacterium]|nr:hypothetical protein [Pseudomonadota bacterium]